jgi:hypothetical protein
MKNILFKISGLAMALIFVMSINSCVKDEFDQPPVLNVPVGEQVTVSDIAALAMTSATPIKITEDQSMFGLVTMGEQSGNFYKQVVFEDATGGIMLEFLGSTSLMVGDSIQVNLKGARVYNYNNLPQVDSLEITYNILKISAGNSFTPQEVSIPDLKTFSYTGRVVKLNDVQFTDSELGNTFADADALITENRDLEDCDNNTVIVRTSGYANFAGELLPEGKGSLIAYVGRYRDDVQLAVRSFTEIDMNGERCDGGGGGGGEPVDPVDVVDEDFQSLADFDPVNLEGWSNIIVAGDRNWLAQEFSSNIYAQASGYNSGLAEMETWLITPPVTNISEKVLSFRSAMAYWEHQDGNKPMTVLISTDFVGDNFETATWTELDVVLADQNSGNYDWVESGEVDLSAFSGNAAIAFKHTGSETESTSSIIDDVLIDVSGGGGNPGGVDPVDEINEDFGSMNDYDDINVEGWSNVKVLGDRAWIARVFDDNPYAQSSGYNSGLAEMETWLITPPVKNIQDKKLSFNSAIAYWAHGSNHPGAVLVSEDFNGENFETATWTEINVTLAQESDGDHTWVASGEYDLSAFSGNAAIAFRYIGSDSESTTLRIDDVVVSDGSGGGGGGGGGTTLPFTELFTEDLGTFSTYDAVGPQSWAWEFYDDGCAKMAGYDNGQIENEDWLISPELDFSSSSGVTMNFRQAANYVNGEFSFLQVLVSTNYTGEGDPNTAIWTEVSVPTWPSGDNWDFIESGSVNLSDYDGEETVFVAFKYTSSNSVASTWEISSVIIE